MAKTSSHLKQVRFYEALDPYYYEVDNRPLRDLWDNLGIISEQIDITRGGFNRGSLAAASIGVQFTANEGFVGNVHFPGGLSLVMLFGYLIQTRQFDNQHPQFRVPTQAVHDAPTDLLNLAAPTKAGEKIKYLVQGYMEPATETSLVPAVDSLTEVARFQVKSVTFKDGEAEPVIYPDDKNTAIFSFVISYGQKLLTEEDLKPINWVSMKDIAGLVNGSAQTKIEKARIRKHRAEVLVPKGSKYVDLKNAPDMDLSLGEDSFDVYISGVYQKNFELDTENRRIVLGGEVTYDVKVQVTQFTLYTYKS